jgi:hypothetical protein
MVGSQKGRKVVQKNQKYTKRPLIKLFDTIRKFDGLKIWLEKEEPIDK